MKIGYGFLICFMFFGIFRVDDSLGDNSYPESVHRCTTMLTDGIRAYALEDYDGAIVSYEAFLALYDSVRISFAPFAEGSLPGSRANLAGAYYHTGQIKKAFYLIHDAKEFHPGNALIDSLTAVISNQYLRECSGLVESAGTLEARLDLGTAFAAVGLFNNAKEQAEIIVAKYPESPDGQFLYGNSIFVLSYMTRKHVGADLALIQNQEALEYFIKSREMGLRSSELYFNLASAYVTAENYTGAMDCLTEGLKLYPEEDRLYSALSFLYGKMALMDEDRAVEYEKLSKMNLRIARRMRPERQINRETIIMGN